MQHHTRPDPPATESFPADLADRIQGYQRATGSATAGVTRQPAGS